MTEVFSAGFPHSDISGSMDICSSPKLFAAYHVFHRLLVPRHPPCALYSLTNWFSPAGAGYSSTIHSVVSLVLGSLFKTSYCLVTSFDVTPRMSWYYLLKDFILINSICSFQGTCLTDVLSVIRKLKSLNPLITGKNQLYGTALPCWSRLTHSSRSYPSQASPLSPPIKMCPFYIKHSREWF